MGQISDIRALVIGYDHYNTLNIIRALGVENIPFFLIIIGKAKSFCIKSKYVNQFHILENLNELLPFLKKIFNSSSSLKPVVITTSDDIEMLLDETYDELKSFLQLHSIDHRQGEIAKLMDKKTMTQLAIESGFEVPFTISVNLKDKERLKETDFQFPCIVKDQFSAKGSKKDTNICFNFKELKEAINKIPLNREKILVQSFIKNDLVLCIAGCRLENGENYTFGTVYKTKAGHHTDNMGLLSYGYLDSKTIEETKIDNFLNLINYYGLYSFELILHNEKYYFLETNLRADGLLYFYQRAGINFPALWVKSHFQDYKLIKSFNTIQRKINGMHEIQYLKNYFSWKNLFSNIKDLVSTDVFSIFTFKDLLPFIYKIKYHTHD